VDAKLETEKTTKLIQEIIQSMMERNAIHQADGLKLGLRDALRQDGATNYYLSERQPARDTRDRAWGVL